MPPEWARAHRGRSGCQAWLNAKSGAACASIHAQHRVNTCKGAQSVRTRHKRLGALGTAVAAVGLSLAMVEPALAAAPPDVVQQDARRDAHPALDVVGVAVSHDDESVKVVVRVRNYVRQDSTSRVPTAIGVHFDISGDRRPDHLIRLAGGAILAVSTWEWNGPNPLAPDGDWSDCAPDGWDRFLVRARPSISSIVFNAPRGCLDDPAEIRVAVQSYRPRGSGLEPDWLKGPRRYTPWISLM